MLLADMGARIIKIEPVDGDPLRTFPPLFASVNRGKQSIAINLKKEAGREVLPSLFLSSSLPFGRVWPSD